MSIGSKLSLCLSLFSLFFSSGSEANTCDLTPCNVAALGCGQTCRQNRCISPGTKAVKVTQIPTEIIYYDAPDCSGQSQSLQLKVLPSEIPNSSPPGTKLTQLPQTVHLKNWACVPEYFSGGTPFTLSAWSECSGSCPGPFTQTRTVTCSLPKGEGCCGDSQSSRACQPVAPCPTPASSASSTK